MNKGILLHEASDDVGVAAMDLQTGEEVQAVTLEGDLVMQVTLVQDIPLGHKVAMRDLAADKHILEYGQVIGRATAPIAQGAHVHVHNIKSLRWAASESKVLVE
jgi:(2R)-sulfolactate sulfo-lyase subunit alpha